MSKTARKIIKSKTSKKKCETCKKNLELIKFSKDKSRKCGLRGQCRLCHSKKRKARYHSHGKFVNTFDRFFKVLVRNAKGRAKTRKRRGRENAGVFNLTFDQVVDLYNKQNGCCFYSGIFMSTKPCSMWKVSIDRIDNDIGYIIDNIVLVCHEFNDRSKWSKEKINELVLEITKIHDFEKIISDINNSLIKKKKIPIKMVKSYKTINNIQHAQCNHCKEYKLMNQYIGTERTCKKCRYDNSKIHKMAIRSHLLKLINHAAKHTIDRCSKKCRRDKGIIDECSITFTDLVDMLKRQRGLCYYSGIELRYGSYLDNNWVASLERKDPTKGYTIDNSCLVCTEFNTASGWSVNKFMYFIEELTGQKHLINCLNN